MNSGYSYVQVVENKPEKTVGVLVYGEDEFIQGYSLELTVGHGKSNLTGSFR